MDANKKVDHLFKDNLRSFEMEPSAGAWSQLEKQIVDKKQNRSGFWLAAASVSLVILTAYWLFYTSPAEEMNQTRIASNEIDHPEMTIQAEWEIHEQEKVVAREMVNKRPPRTINKTEPLQLDGKQERVELLAIEGKKPGAMVLSLVEPEVMAPTVEKPSTVRKPQLRITYIAAEESIPGKPDNNRTFKKLISFAGKISPGQVLLDMKEAKDSFLNERLRSDKNRQSL